MMQLKFRKKKKDQVDYLRLTRKEKLKKIGFFCLKWGGVILVVEIIILVILDATGYIGVNFFSWSMLLIPGILLTVGGCMGGLGRYHVPPKMRIIEPNDQDITPSDFQIRVRFDSAFVDKETIKVTVNERVLPSKMDEESRILIVPKVFKSPPKRAVSLLLEATALDKSGKEMKDKIRVISDPEYEAEDYLEYWEFKREDDTYWGKEMIAATKQARRTLISLELMVLAIILLAFNALISAIYNAIV
jgi:hypothetical protein